MNQTKTISGDLAEFFSAHQLSFRSFTHPPVYTCQEAQELNLNIPGFELKNLFLRDRKGTRYFLLAVPVNKSVDLKALARSLNLSGLGFASADRLKSCLGLEPGAVTVLAVFCDKENMVELLVDEAAWQADLYQCHPLVNTATWVVGRGDLERFFELTGHKAMVLPVPGRTDR